MPIFIKKVPSAHVGNISSTEIVYRPAFRWPAKTPSQSATNIYVEVERTGLGGKQLGRLRAEREKNCDHDSSQSSKKGKSFFLDSVFQVQIKGCCESAGKKVSTRKGTGKKREKKPTVAKKKNGSPAARE